MGWDGWDRLHLILGSSFGTWSGWASCLMVWNKRKQGWEGFQRAELSRVRESNRPGSGELEGKETCTAEGSGGLCACAATGATSTRVGASKVLVPIRGEKVEGEVKWKVVTWTNGKRRCSSKCNSKCDILPVLLPLELLLSHSTLSTVLV